MGDRKMAMQMRALTCVAKRAGRQSVRLMSAEADAYQSLRSKEAFFGSAHEQPTGYKPYKNPIHEQDELWWDDGTARREPIFDSDFIPMSEAVPMFFAGMGLFAAVAGIHYVLDPAESRPTVPRQMPEAHIWQKPYQGEAEDEDEDEE